MAMQLHTGYMVKYCVMGVPLRSSGRAGTLCTEDTGSGSSPSLGPLLRLISDS